MYLKTLRDTGLHATDPDQPVNVPDNIDYEKYRRGQQFFQRNVYACTYAMLTSLICGLSVENLLCPLVFTKQSDEPLKALRRYIKTFQHVGLWHFYDIFDEESPASKSLCAVRRQHNSVRDAMNTLNHNAQSAGYTVGSDTNKISHICSDPVDMGTGTGGPGMTTHFSQYDYSLVQCGFIGAVVMYPSEYGIKCTEKDLDDFVYLWYCIGCFLGITDANNICRNGYSNAWNICKEIEKDILFPAMHNPPSDFEKMAQALVSGINRVFRFPLHSVNAFIAATPSIVALSVQSRLTFADRLRVMFLRSIVILVKYFSPVRNFLNRSFTQLIKAEQGRN